MILGFLPYLMAFFPSFRSFADPFNSKSLFGVNPTYILFILHFFQVMVTLEALLGRLKKKKKKKDYLVVESCFAYSSPSPIQLLDLRMMQSFHLYAYFEVQLGGSDHTRH